jgi:hypothetical protein
MPSKKREKMLISLRRAARWLQRNLRKRKLDASLVRTYSRAMDAGEWSLRGIRNV